MENTNLKLYSLTTTYPESENSTKPKFVHALNKELVKLGVDVTVIAPHSKKLPQQLTLNSVMVHFFKYLPERYEISTSIPDEVKKTTGKIKVIFMTLGFFFYVIKICKKDKNFVLHGNWAFPGGYIAFLASKFLKKDFIVTVHGSEVPLLNKLNFLKKIVVNSLNHSSRVIASNAFLKNQLMKMGVYEEKISLIKPIPNFVDHHTDSKKLIEFKKQFTDPSNKIILFVGRLTEVKGVEFLIKSMKEISIDKIHLIIAGDGVLRHKLQNLTNKLGLEKKISFFGAANHSQLGLLYDISDVFVSPSIIDSKGGTEGTGLTIIEAMESSLPVIASNVGGIAETIVHETNGLLVEEKSPVSIAKAIEKIFSDENLHHKLIKNSKSTVAEFLPETIARKYYDIICDLNQG